MPKEIGGTHVQMHYLVGRLVEVDLIVRTGRCVVPEAVRGADKSPRGDAGCIGVCKRLC